MSVATRVLAWLDRRSDDVSPLVVKEVRQLVRSREFLLSLNGSLVAGLIVAFVGATEALSGSSTSGRWTFTALMGCLAFLGLAVVPLGAFNTLRYERMEQTLELITLTSLSQRRIVVGKLLAQSVKLLTLFAAVAPFLTMSFLLGGIDFTTIVISLVLLYMGSVWVGAFCLFLSALFKARAASAIVFGAVGIFVVFVLSIGSSVFRMGMVGVVMPGMGMAGLSVASAAMFKAFAVLATFWATTVVNFVLLAENRLSLATEDTVTPLRIGFFVQFLLVAGWAINLLFSTFRTSAAEALTLAASIHLGVVAVFVLTEEMSVPRRVLHRMRVASGVRRLLVLFGPGAGRGAAYVGAQMLILTAVVVICPLPSTEERRILAACGYICFLTGVPVLAFWRLAPARVSPLKLRVAVLCAVAAVMVLPDLVHYVIVQPEVLDLSYSWWHLVNPFRTIAQWDLVETRGWTAIPLAMCLTGALSYVLLFFLGARVTSQTTLVDSQAVPVGEATGRGNSLY